ncbi:unnamed protein product [Bathycoccus prasinos]
MVRDKIGYVFTNVVAGSADSTDSISICNLCGAGKPRGGDFSSAYLHVPEEKEIFRTNYTGKVLKLKKKLYGAKSSGLGWYEHLKGTIAARRFLPTSVEPTLFIGDTPDEDGDIPLLMTVVDDFVYLKLVKQYRGEWVHYHRQGNYQTLRGNKCCVGRKQSARNQVRSNGQVEVRATDYGEQHGAKKRNTPLKSYRLGYLKNEDRKEFTIKYDFSECPRDVRLYAFSDEMNSPTTQRVRSQP